MGILRSQKHSGKSALLHCLGGDAFPGDVLRSGGILYDGKTRREYLSDPALRSKTAFISATDNHFEELSVGEPPVCLSVFNLHFMLMILFSFHKLFI